jgi:hypothetical protein
LQPTQQTKYDPFWVVLLIVAGAALAFYLLGIAIMAVGLALLGKQKQRWVCPHCGDQADRQKAQA